MTRIALDLPFCLPWIFLNSPFAPSSLFKGVNQIVGLLIGAVLRIEKGMQPPSVWGKIRLNSKKFKNCGLGWMLTFLVPSNATLVTIESFY